MAQAKRVRRFGLEARSKVEMTYLADIKLLPCPFCGGQAEIKRKGTYRQSMVIGCTNCHGELESGDVVGLTRPVDYGWNKRAKIEPK